MPNCERGILGYKKDPKHQMLFTFGKSTKADDWPSEDSDDSDYDPVEHCISTKKKNRKRKKVGACESSIDSSDSSDSDLDCDGRKEWPSKKKKINSEKVKRIKRKKHKSKTKVTEAFESFQSPTTTKLVGNPWGEKIPPEVLLKIFQYVVHQYGSLPFLPRACKVCQLWNATATDATLWHDVDLSYGWIKPDSDKLKWLCENRMSLVRKLDLSGRHKLVTNDVLEFIGQACPAIQEINLEGCMKIKACGLHAFIKSCPQLHSIDVSQTLKNVGYKSDIVSSKSLTAVIDRMGDRLQALNLSYHSLSGFTVVIKNIASRCHKLRHLEICSASMPDYLNLNIEALQEGCPALQVLALSCTPFKTNPRPSREVMERCGFNHLEELRIMCNITLQLRDQGPSDDALSRLLRTSTNLRSLDVRCCKTVTASSLSGLCCKDLRYLHLSWSSVPNKANIASVFSKWSHSLLELDVGSCTYCELFPESLKHLCLTQSKLENLNLTGSNITMEVLRDLLIGCKKIKTLDISSCRSLDKGFKRKYENEEIRALKSRLKI